MQNIVTSFVIFPYSPCFTVMMSLESQSNFLQAKEFLNLHFEPLWWFTHSSFPDILKWVECEKKRCIIMTSNRENEESQPKRAISFMVQGIHILQSRKLWTLRSSGETWKRRMCANILRSKWFFLLPIFSINAPKRIYGFLRIILLTGVWVEFIITSNLKFFFHLKKERVRQQAIIIFRIRRCIIWAVFYAIKKRWICLPYLL